MQNLNRPDYEGGAGTAAAGSHLGSVIFSIIIPALNEAQIIGQCLDSIACLDFPHRQFEVIVVDNGSSDRTCEIAESYREAMKIEVLRRPKINISALRNAGAAAATGEFLVFLDADMLVRKKWLRTAKQLFSSSKADIIGGCLDAPEHSSWIANVWFSRKTKAVNLSPSYVPSALLMVRRSQFKTIGGFNESLVTSEDCDFCCRARAQGMTMAVYAAVSAVHLGSPQTLRAFFRRELWHGSSVFQVFLHNLHSLQNIKPIAFAIYTLLCFVMIFVTTVNLAFRGNISLFLLFAGMLLLAPFVLALRYVRPLNWQYFPALFILLLIYGVARAISLVGFRNRRTRRRDQADEIQVAS